MKLNLLKDPGCPIFIDKDIEQNKKNTL